MSLARSLAFSTLLLWSACAVHGQDELRAADHHPDVARLVGAYLSQLHYASRPIDDAISTVWFDECIASLDGERMYFHAGDIAELEAFRSRLDDQMRAADPDLSAAFTMFERYRQRVRERVAFAGKLLERDAPFDFERQESFVVDREQAPWAADSAGLDELWRKYLKEQALRGELAGESATVYVPRLRERLDGIAQGVEELEARDVVEIFLAALCRAFDPHTTYLKPITRDNFDIQQGHSLEGIGAVLRRDGQYTVISELVAGGPAQRSKKIAPQDRIVAVRQVEEGAEWVEVLNWRLDNVVKLIRGPKGSQVILRILPGDELDPTATRDVTIERDKIVLTANDAKLEIETHAVGDDTLRLGVLTVPSFYAELRPGEGEAKSLTSDVRKLLEERGAGLDGMLIDVRSNAGGSLLEALTLTGLFIEEGPVVQVRDSKGETQVLEDPDPALVFGGPLVVLTSPLSASAAEIFAAAIQDYGRGLVVGSRTHGKGTVQRVMGLDAALKRLSGGTIDDELGGAIKLTVAKFYRISGGSTQRLGVSADIPLPSSYDGLDVYESDLENALPWDEIEPVEHGNFPLRPGLDLLSSRSAARVAADPDFQALSAQLSERAAELEKGSVSLHLPTRRAERTAREERGVPTPGRDFLFEEARAVAFDYLQLLAGTELPELETAE